MGSIVRPGWPLPRSRRYRTSPGRTGRRDLLTLALLLAVCATAAGSFVAADFYDISLPAYPSRPVSAARLEPVSDPSVIRPVFRHSVVAGGVYTADEVEATMNRDSVVAAHYSAVNGRELRVETLREDRDAYMSYRIGDDIFWTKHKMRLKQGETILTDGVNRIRARCGNCIAFAPMEPTSDDEPGEMEFDALSDDLEVIQSRMPLGDELLRQPLTDISLLSLPGDSSHPFAAANYIGGGSLGIPFYGYGDRTEVTLPDAASQLVLFALLDSPSDGSSQSTDGFTDPLPEDWNDSGNQDRPGGGTHRHPEVFGEPHHSTLPPPESPVAVPEPATLVLVGSGIATLLARRRRLGRR